MALSEFTMSWTGFGAAGDAVSSNVLHGWGALRPLQINRFTGDYRQRDAAHHRRRRRRRKNADVLRVDVLRSQLMRGR